MAATKPAKRTRTRKPRLRDRVRGTDPRRTGRDYMRALHAKRHEAARRRDRKSYDEFWAGTFERLFPNA